MLKSFLDWFKSEPELKEEAQIDAAQRAASALMVEVVLADTHFSEHEKEHLLETLKKQTGLTTQECIERTLRALKWIMRPPYINLLGI